MKIGIISITQFICAFTTVFLASDLVSAEPQCVNPRVMIVLDKSSSMVTGKVGDKTKWEIAKGAISTLLNKYAGIIDFGLMVFPASGGCSSGTKVVDMNPNNTQDIIQSLSSPPPAHGYYTPLAQTLDVAASLKDLQDSERNNNVLVISDGWQWCSPYVETTRFHPVNATKNLTTLKISTYVVGFGDSVDALTLNKMAEAANTKADPNCDPASEDIKSKNCYYQANDSQGLTAALEKIAQHVKEEKCDNIDNDCDKQIDEDLTRVCTNACGSGVEKCVNGEWTDCDAPKPTEEICDGIDNNCNNTKDEGCVCLEGETQECGGNGLGECKKGTQVCEGGVWQNCTGFGQPSQEICDGKDNDCDGTEDGPNAICENGGVCINGQCYERNMDGVVDGGCDCQLGTSTKVPLLPIFGALLFLVLLMRSRRK